MAETCRTCDTTVDVCDGWCDPCFRARIDRLVHQIDHATAETLTRVYVSGMRELGAEDRQIV